MPQYDASIPACVPCAIMSIRVCVCAGHSVVRWSVWFSPEAQRFFIYSACNFKENFGCLCLFGDTLEQWLAWSKRERSGGVLRNPIKWIQKARDRTWHMSFAWVGIWAAACSQRHCNILQDIWVVLPLDPSFDHGAIEDTVPCCS